MIPDSPTRSKRSAGPRDIVQHQVKSWPQFFELILSGKKTHELRRIDDRDFRVGDLLLLQEFDAKTNRYSGRELTVRITYITSADLPCAYSEDALHPDFCILSIKKL
jgi:Domain of unknown function (DUF3850)